MAMKIAVHLSLERFENDCETETLLPAIATGIYVWRINKIKLVASKLRFRPLPPNYENSSEMIPRINLAFDLYISLLNNSSTNVRCSIFLLETATFAENQFNTSILNLLSTREQKLINHLNHQRRNYSITCLGNTYQIF